VKKIEGIDFKAVMISIDKMDDDKKELATSLVNELMFMKDTLQSLKTVIEEKGVITDMPQGAYSIKRSNPALQTYKDLIKNYMSCIKQLNELLPKDALSEEDNFDEF